MDLYNKYINYTSEDLKDLFENLMIEALAKGLINKF